MTDVVEQLGRIQRVMDLLVPGGAGLPVIDRARLEAALPAPVPSPPAPAVPASVSPASASPASVPSATAAPGPVAPAPVPEPAAVAPPVSAVQPVQFRQPVEHAAEADFPAGAGLAVASSSPGGHPGASSAAAALPIEREDTRAAVMEVPVQRRPSEAVTTAIPSRPADPSRSTDPSRSADPSRLVDLSRPADLSRPGDLSRPAEFSRPVGEGSRPISGGVPVANGAAPNTGAVSSAAPVSPAPAVPSWASTGTGARPAVTVVGSPWWRLAVERLSRLVAAEISPEDLPDMTYLRVTELARALAPRVNELGEGVVRAFVNDYVRELGGEHVESAYPWRDLLPEPATAPPGSPAWMVAVEELRDALVEELTHGEPRDAQELAALLAPSAPRLDDVTVHGFIADYLLALGGQSGPGSTEPWQHLLPRPQAGRGPSDEEVLEVYGDQLDEHLRTTGRLSRYKVQAVTGVKSRIQADRIKTVVEERAANSAPAGL